MEDWASRSKPLLRLICWRAMRLGKWPWAVVAVVACGPSGDAGGLASSGRAEKQELVVAVGADDSGLQLNRGRLGRYPLNAGICEPLVKLTPDFRVDASLAKYWSYVGANTYRFTLRHGLRFHDGKPLSAEAVKYTLERSIADKTQYSFLSPSSIRIIDDSTLDISPSIPNLRLLEQLVHPSYGIVAEGSDPSKFPDCTGAFRFLDYVAKDHLTVVRNDAYWGEKAKLNRVTFRFMPDDNTRALALRAGQVDVIDVNSSMVSSLKATHGIRIVTAAPGAVILVYIATHGTDSFNAMSNPVLRRAVALAIDRRTLVENVMDGYGAIVNTVNPPAVLGKYAGLVHGVLYDSAESNRLLDSAGWKRNAAGERTNQGRRLTLALIHQPNVIDRSITQYVQAQLAKAGITVTIDELDGPAYENRLNSGEFDLDVEIPNQNDANPAFLLALRWYGMSNVKSASFMRAGAAFDSLVSRSLASVDRDSAQMTAAEAMHVLVDEEVAAIPLAGISRIFAMSSKVRGFSPHPSRLNQSWSAVWMAK